MMNTFNIECSPVALDHLVDVSQFQHVNFVGQKEKNTSASVEQNQPPETIFTHREILKKNEAASELAEMRTQNEDIHFASPTDDSMDGNTSDSSRDLSPVKVDKLVLSTLKKLDNECGSTLAEIIR